MKLTPDIETFIPGAKDEICTDDEARLQRKKILGNLSYNSLFFGVNQALNYVSGIIASVGLTMISLGIKEVMDVPNATLTFSALQATTLGTMGLSVLAGAAATMAVGLAAHQVSSRVFHAASFDQSEINAQHTAKYMAKELKKELESLRQPAAEPSLAFVNENAKRSDGLSWADMLNQQAANQNLQR